MLAEGVRRLAEGERPRTRDMLLTLGNIGTVADRMPHLRGAAMKLGQVNSLDAGDMLATELTVIMGCLREDAHHMPPAQLTRMLAEKRGEDWRTRFQVLEPRPLAAASIGQVQPAISRDGRELAIRSSIPAFAKASMPMRTMSRRCSGFRACCRSSSISRRCSPKPNASLPRRRITSARARR